MKLPGPNKLLVWCHSIEKKKEYKWVKLDHFLTNFPGEHSTKRSLKPVPIKLLSLFIFLSNSNFLSHTIHVWYIYLFMANVRKYTIHGWHGFDIPKSFLQCHPQMLSFPNGDVGPGWSLVAGWSASGASGSWPPSLAFWAAKSDSSERCRQGFVSKKSPAGPFLNGPRKNLRI